jgi:hypothetical protein
MGAAPCPLRGATGHPPSPRAERSPGRGGQWQWKCGNCNRLRDKPKGVCRCRPGNITVPPRLQRTHNKLASRGVPGYRGVALAFDRLIWPPSLGSPRAQLDTATNRRLTLSSFGGEGWGEEAVMPKSTRLRPSLRLCPSPRPSPRASLAGRGRSPRWQCRTAPVRRCLPHWNLTGRPA